MKDPVTLLNKISVFLFGTHSKSDSYLDVLRLLALLHVNYENMTTQQYGAPAH